MRRPGSIEKTNKLANEINESGGWAKGFGVDARDEDSIVNLFKEVEENIAPIDVVINYAMGDNTVYFGKKEKNQNLCLGNITMYSKRSTGQLQFKMNYKPMLKELGHKFRIFHF